MLVAPDILLRFLGIDEALQPSEVPLKSQTPKETSLPMFRKKSLYFFQELCFQALKKTPETVSGVAKEVISQ